jgi:hypothetical protein
MNYSEPVSANSFCNKILQDTRAEHLFFRADNFLLSLREEYGLKAFENMMLRRIFVPKRDEVTVEWRKLHNEELRDLYSSPSIIKIIKSRRMRWARHVARMGEKRNAYRLFGWKARGKETTGKTKT